MTETISTLVEAGNASAGPPLGPALGPLPVDIGQVVSEINEKTSGFEGMEVPVEVEVDEETGEFTVEVGTPPAAALLKDKAGVETGSGEPDKVKVANIPVKHVFEVAELKMGDLVALDLRGASKEILGSAQSLGFLVDGKEPKKVQEEVDEGVYDEVLEGEKDIEELPEEAEGEEVDVEEARKRLEERREEREEEEEVEEETGEEEEAGEDEEEDEEETGEEGGEP